MSLSDHIKYYNKVVQGSDEWIALRRGIITASEMKLILTPTLKTANNDKEKAHMYELAAQRITEYVEPHYISDDMLRGCEDEIEARQLYDLTYAKVQEVGFIVNNSQGFKIGYSPDGVVGDDGLIECKGRRQKYQLSTIIEGKVPPEHMLQVQTGLWVTGRKWCDFISYCGGMDMITIRVFPDIDMQEAIVNAATEFEARVNKIVERFRMIQKEGFTLLIPTERRIEMDISI